jgi:hypothetical protein
MPALPAAFSARLLRRVARGALVTLGIGLGLYTSYVLIGPNFHTILPGVLYRCAQPSAAQLQRLVRRYGIRTVVNLRGCCDPLPFYLEECRAANRLNLSQEDISLSANRLPSTQALRQLVAVVENSQYPLLFHCNKGADRSGLASAAALLLLTDTPLEQARQQVGPRYGHLPLGRTAHIDRFFDLYQDWLTEHGLAHSRTVFRRWALQEYCPGECRCEFQVLGPWARPLPVRPGVTIPFAVRCYNTSVKPWHMRAESNVGIHASFTLLDDQGRIVCDGRGGLMDRTVRPGEWVDLTLAIPVHKLWGRYELRVDLVDEQHAYFMQTGCEPLIWELEVRP